MRDVVTCLLEMNLYAVVIWAGIMLLRKVAGRRLSAGLRLVIWVLFVARLVCPVTLDTGLRLLPQLPDVPASLAHASHQSPHDVQGGRLLPVADAPGTSQETWNMEPDASPAHAGEFQASGRVQIHWTLPEVLAWVWISGAAIVTVSVAVGYASLRRRVRLGATQPGRRLEEVFRACCIQMRIRRRLQLVVSEAVGGPAFLVPNTVLYPVQSGSMSMLEMRMSMTHEFTHYKRGDGVLLLLLLAVRVVHWFNPVVWIATRQMREDMEAACDSDVVRGWSPASKAEYAKTILHLYGTVRASGEIVCFAGSRTAKQVEERIRRIFMKPKSSRTARVAALMVAGILALACFTTACQPAPATPHDGQEVTSQLGAESVDDPPAVIPDDTPEEDFPSRVVPGLSDSGTWDAELAMPDGAVAIHASELLPRTDTLPVYSMEHTQITPEMAEKVAHVLWSGNMPEFKAFGSITREERDAIVGQYGSMIRRYEEEGPDPDETMSADERIAEWKAVIENAEKCYQESLTQDAPQPADFSRFYWNPWAQEQGLWYEAHFADGTGGQLTACPMEEGQTQFGGSISYWSDAWEDSTMAGFTGSLDEAVQDASAIVGALDSGTWTLVSASNDDEIGCCFITFRPSAGSVPWLNCRLQSATIPSVMTEEQSAAYERGELQLPVEPVSESLKICYDDTGMVGFFWSSPWSIAGIADEAPDVMPIEDAELEFLSRFPDNNGDGIQASDITLDRVELVYALSAANEARDSWQLVPVYDFVGSTKRHGHHAGEEFPMSFMTLNALDGSIIQRHMVQP